MAVVTTASIILFGLVVVRMAGLVRQQERSLDRERLLSSAGAALVGATSRRRSRASPWSRRGRSPAAGRRRCCSAPATDGGWSCSPRPAPRSAATGRAPSATRSTPRSTEAPSGRARCCSRRARSLARRPGAARAGHGDPDRPARRRRPGARRRRRRPARGVRQAALRALATQVALALDSAALTEEVHRRSSEARFGSLVQHSSDLITVLGPDGEIMLPEPVDRARARLHARRRCRAPLRRAGDAGGPPSPRPSRRLRRDRDAASRRRRSSAG